MIKSMTGYGQGSSPFNEGECTVSLRTLNSKYLDFKLSGIDGYPDLDIPIRKLIREKLERGSVQLNINLDGELNGNDNIKFNQNRFEQIDHILSTIQKKYGRHLNIADVVSSKDIFVDNREKQTDYSPVMKAIENAIIQVDIMRKKEGEKTAEDITILLDELIEIITGLKEKTSELNEKKIQKYREKIQGLLDGIPMDESRLNMEIAIMADKSDVSEEISRSLSHVEQFKHLIQLDEPVGKRMNFLAQELNREINTLGVKSSDIDVSRDVINMKSIVDKIREQIQNIL